MGQQVRRLPTDPSYRTIACSTPVEPELLENLDESEDSVGERIKMDIIEEATDESSTEMEEHEKNKVTNRASDTIPPGIFYPSSTGIPDSNLKVKLINQSLTAKNDNILHFLLADGEFTTLVSKLLLDLGNIDKMYILDAKPKQGQVIITNKSNTKVFTGILKQKHFGKYSLQELTTVLENLADALIQYKIKILRISKNNDMTDQLTFSTFVDLIRKILSKCDITIFICYGSTTIPPDDLHQEMIRENHNSLIGGHKGY